jgi:hypothetical protein
MLKSFLLSRPYAIFDATNVEHRREYQNYLKTGTWANCKFQFVLEEPFLDLPNSINDKLVRHYMNIEFKKVKTKVRIR